MESKLDFNEKSILQKNPDIETIKTEEGIIISKAKFNMISKM